LDNIRLYQLMVLWENLVQASLKLPNWNEKGIAIFSVMRFGMSMQIRGDTISENI
jgi:hypothetical protein